MAMKTERRIVEEAKRDSKVWNEDKAGEFSEAYSELVRAYDSVTGAKNMLDIAQRFHSPDSTYGIFMRRQSKANAKMAISYGIRTLREYMEVTKENAGFRRSRTIKTREVKAKIKKLVELVESSKT